MAGNALIEVRRDTAANWTSANPTLAAGEPGYESDTGKLKFGDGTTLWASLAYFVGGGNAPNIQPVTSAATVTPTFSNDLVKITAQAAALTLANWSGTAVPGWGMAIRIKDNGTARAITFGTQYRAVGVTLPTTTVISKTLYLACIWNSDDTKIDVVSVAQEA